MINNEEKKASLKYVLYERVKDNEAINKIDRRSSLVKIASKTDNGITIKEIVDFSKYQDARTIDELSQLLLPNEHLIIELTPDLEATINPENIMEYQTPTRKAGEKLYLIDASEFNRIRSEEATIAKHFEIIQVIMNPDETCNWEIVKHYSESKRELDENLKLLYGGYSGVYYMANKETIEANAQNYYEITKLEDGKWEFIQLTKGKQY